ncbi:hypothetical protein BCT56_02235 [Vibrio lentus]|uniref:Uncharacterized protein n=1 Tax=Vibrio lentus TaxID=136468 RepID=A0AB36XKR7_9VIBR|nr:hypothetical protein BCU51_25775 [Vibrio lentus]PMK36368.1 hypothetical protein BCU02_12225 [Vibrio lentus]PMK44335.1 hypothetical protein BCT99_24650 [Vibrio lentus]PML32960.1 hypothetical protein BCT79_14835 [Vibrio lentus]PMM29123.1 hypothetical protein BCT56_02235 [Vibrio lentus]
MVYQWAVFRHQRPIFGAGCELFFIMLAFLSIALPLIYEESLLILGVSSGFAIICFILFLFFAQSDKLRRSMRRSMSD